MPDIRVAKADQLEPGRMIPVRVGTKAIVVFRTAEGEICALEDRCSHAEVRLSGGKFDGREVECPAHGARFEVTTGRPLCMPAVAPVKRYAVKVIENEVFVVLP